MKVKKIIKKITACLLGSIMVLSVVGCSQGEGKNNKNSTNSGTTNATDTTKAEEQITLKFLYIWPEYEETMTKTIEGFEKENPNIKVEVAVCPWDQVQKVLQTRIASGDQPDVSFMWPHRMAPYVENGQALDITPYMTDEWKNTFASEDELIKDTKDGKLYNIPFKGTAPVIFYNKDMYDENDITFPQYVEDVPAIGDKLKSKDITMFGLAGKPNGFGFINILKQLTYADTIYDLKVSKTDEWVTGRMFTDDISNSYAKAMQNISGWVKNGYVSTNNLTQTASEAQTLFANGKVSCIAGNNNELNAIKELVDFNVGVTTSPLYKSVNEKALIAATFDGFFASGTTKYPEESAALLKYLTSKDVQTMWVKECNATPVVKDIQIDDPSQAEVAKLFEYFVPDQQFLDYTVDQEATWAMQAEILANKNATEKDYQEYGKKMTEYFKEKAEEYDANK
ncbi:ABC transporter substrate-binding protein [Clostridium grantii]|uniref:ABC-type glycerol-3-phosphate transport system, substrate-binding protein n=1 Tax=Clostridium grantii DSM 8605 TaxID=1121316 RepID=A0A1M5VB89_9CLOT|nr:extracellular solute-binding protein [Clostridium grantii]SHH72485.1 ABC-type glycerol-3-phosphate transport system, substrate-binding protein [Clostridium grantii DSM 8605]